MQDIQWRHRIELPDGTVTPGGEDTAMELSRLRLDRSLSGKRVLDVGCSDGFYSFEAERRGADVLAIDDESSLLTPGGNGFQFAKEQLGSQVEYRAADVEELDADDVGRFDLILFINVLYHVRNPVRALTALAHVANPGARLVLKTYFQSDVRFWFRGRCISIDVDPRPKCWFYPDTELAGDPTNWWGPNRRGLNALLTASGWKPTDKATAHGDRLYVHALRS